MATVCESGSDMSALSWMKKVRLILACVYPDVERTPLYVTLL